MSTTAANGKNKAEGKKSLDVHMQDALKLDSSISEDEEESIKVSSKRRIQRKLEESEDEPMHESPK